MKAIQSLFLICRNQILIFCLLGTMLVRLSFLVINSSTAQTNDPAKTPQSEADYLNGELQKNGTVAVLVSIKSPDFDPFEKTVLPPGNETLLKARLDTALLLSNQARARLLKSLTGYHIKVYVGTDWYTPDIGLDVDQIAFNYLKTSPLVAGLSRDHVMTFADTVSAR